MDNTDKIFNVYIDINIKQDLKKEHYLCNLNFVNIRKMLIEFEKSYHPFQLEKC